VPGATPWLTLTVIVVDATAPAAKVPLGWQVTTPAACVQVQPVSVPRETKVTLAGKVSVSVVALPAATEPGPLLVTERVKVSVPPSRTGFGVADVETKRSVWVALDATVLVMTVPAAVPAITVKPGW